MSREWKPIIAIDIINLIWDTLDNELKIFLLTNPTIGVSPYSEEGFRIWVGGMCRKSPEETEKAVEEVYRRSKLEAFK